MNSPYSGGPSVWDVSRNEARYGAAGLLPARREGPFENLSAEGKR